MCNSSSAPLLLIIFGIVLLALALVEGQLGISFIPLSKEQVNAMAPEQRLKYTNAFLDMARSTGNGSPKNDNCNPDGKFWRSCYQIGMTCSTTDPDQLILDACKYPPNDLGSMQGICLGYYINEYIESYADGVDNSACCLKAGVPTECTWMVFWTVDCTDFCKGNHHLVEAVAAYRCCADYVSQIATCNKAGTSLTTDTAAVRWNFCGRECTPAFPEWCKKKKEGKGKLN